MISFLTEVIGIRDDMFVGEGHEYMREVAESVEQGFKDGVLPQRPARHQPAVRPRPSDAVDGRPAAPAEDLRRPREAQGQEDRHDLGLLALVRQAALGAAGHHHPDDPLRHERRAGAPRGLRPAARDARGRRASTPRQSGGSFKKVHSMAEAFEGRRHRLSQELGAVRGDAEAHRAAARRPGQASSRRSRRRASPTTRATRTGSAPRS